RMMFRCFICFANRGRCSQIWPPPVVEIGLNSPPLGLPGFRSQISIVEGPPLIHSRIMLRDLSTPPLARAAWSEFIQLSIGKVMLAAVICLTKCRRLMPSDIRLMLIPFSSQARPMGVRAEDPEPAPY